MNKNESMCGNASTPPAPLVASTSRFQAALSALAFLCVTGLCSQAETFQVSSLDLQAVEQDWSEAHRDKSVDGNALSVGGFKFEHGVGTHADSSMLISLDGKAERFSAVVGVDGDVGH